MVQVGVIGGGAIGLLIAAHLAKSHQVTVYVRNLHQLNRLAENGITVKHWEKSVNVSVRLVDDFKEHDVVFVCVKQHQLEKLLPNLKNNLSPLIFLQNGMAHVDTLRDINLMNTILIGSCEHGALKLGDHVVEQTGNGRINVALYKGGSKEFNSLLQAINTKGFPFVQLDNWFELLDKKLVANAVINPLTAIFEVRNGEILTNRELLTLAKQLCYETCQVLGLSDDKEWENIMRIIALTKTNYSSMMMDIKNGRSTEIESISGYLLKHTKSSVPYTEFVYHAIKALENKTGVRERND